MNNENQNMANDQMVVDGMQVYVPTSQKAAAFSNSAYTQFGPEEFGIDFLNLGGVSSSVVARVVLTPSHMKRLANLLSAKVEEYEETFGEIPENIKPLK
ncbi:TPA: DUF3467 domain-containing protein [Vibrio parahaemolyticus]|uniref:DUF3467 domain-containing protein n=1 Tax=Vibrio parahaemolyticus TaxID=670 RepID=UPI00041B731E|nr:DUF3467 domain-containing protein [Vibrio parahaemolyticus]KJR16753.1 hypothetical protein UF29_19785 [Vibrio parahaemolyticus]MBE5196219.1 DUF3467 domain-containing protein [Vibrio parahaemolyticus]MDF4395695.1 DUF3467 domain-containing protein [Vibrio parahaemolyticus]TOE28252.1 DUF3467 domain-containing protein [Vibrio parahaemolyticus]HCE1960039.1 DUF3467 domain-containing protein [Vibrio parahaemolyticus]